MLRRRCRSGVQPARHPGYFSTPARPGAGLVMRAEGSAGRASAWLCPLFPRQGQGAAGWHGTGAATEVCGKWPLE